MLLLTKHILRKYLKYFFIILVSLELFFIGIDFLQNVSKLPNSANLQLLYILYNGFFTLTITLPLSLIFAWIITLTVFIKDNEVVSFYSLGVSKKQIIQPIINISLFITIVLLSLQSTPLAYSYEEKQKIINNQYFSSEQSNIFLKYDDYFIYFEKLYPIEKKAVGIHIFKIKNYDMVESIVGKEAYYKDNKWYVTDTKIIKKPAKIDWDSSKLEISHKDFLYTLEGFEPKIINNVYKANVQFSNIDAIKTIVLLDNQDFNTNKIRAILYAQIFLPFFVIPLLVVIFLLSEASGRFFNIGRFISLAVFITLCVWGIMFLLQKLALGSIVLAELAILLPLSILFVSTYYLYTKKVN